MNADILPPRDQKAYDLGARSAREVIDHLRGQLEEQASLAMAARAQADHWKANHADVVRRKHGAAQIIGRLVVELQEHRDTIRNQNSHMAWQEGQLQEGAARERAYCEAINDLCDEVVRIHAKARAVLEGRPEQEVDARRPGNGSCGSRHVPPFAPPATGTPSSESGLS